MPQGNEELLRGGIVAAGAVLKERKLITGLAGNVSCRLSAEAILITPRGVDKGRLTTSEIVYCRFDGKPPQEASIEVNAHLATYRRCPEVRAIIHAHPIAVLRLDQRGGLGALVVTGVDPELLPRLETVPPMVAGSEQLAGACAAALARAPLAVLAGHGVMAVGRHLREALARVELVERLAREALGQESPGAAP
jgi:L-fuculose-phosphate aldolase